MYPLDGLYIVYVPRTKPIHPFSVISHKSTCCSNQKVTLSYFFHAQHKTLRLDRPCPLCPMLSRYAIHFQHAHNGPFKTFSLFLPRPMRRMRHLSGLPFFVRPGDNKRLAMKLSIRNFCPCLEEKSTELFKIKWLTIVAGSNSLYISIGGHLDHRRKAHSSRTSLLQSWSYTISAMLSSSWMNTK